jgi:hypothetical protein
MKLTRRNLFGLAIAALLPRPRNVVKSIYYPISAVGLAPIEEISYKFPVNGNVTESIWLRAHVKVWRTISPMGGCGYDTISQWERDLDDYS